MAPLGPPVLNYQCEKTRPSENCCSERANGPLEEPAGDGSTKKPVQVRTIWQGNEDNMQSEKENDREEEERHRGKGKKEGTDSKKGTYLLVSLWDDLRTELEESRSSFVLSNYMPLYHLQNLRR